MGVLPLLSGRRRAKVGVALLALILAGCGGGGNRGAVAQQVTGSGFTFQAPGGWRVTTAPRKVTAAPAGGLELLSVSVFELVRPYRPALWPKVVPELDRVARKLAAGLGGSVRSSRTVVLAGRRARRYDIRYSRDGRQLVERIAFVLKGRREYELLCRFEAGQVEVSADACAALFSTIKLT